MLLEYGWFAYLFVVLFVLWFSRHMRRPAVKHRWDARLLKMPLIGDLLTKVEVARFARTLATLLGNGVTLLSGLTARKPSPTGPMLLLAGGILSARSARLSPTSGWTGRPCPTR